MPIRPRRSLTTAQRRVVREKTGGRCHVCGGKLGRRWAADHVFAFAHGGLDGLDNFLPSCAICNGLRWHRTAGQIRRVMRLGMLAVREVRKRSVIGIEMARLANKRNRSNAKRRRKT